MSAPKVLDLRGLSDAERDAKVNEAVAILAGLLPPFSVANEKWSDEGGGGYRDVSRDSIGREVASYATSADAVLPLLEKHEGPWNMDYDRNDKRPENRYQVYMHFPKKLAPEDSMKCGNGATFALAACFALLHANGFEILT